MTTIKIFRWTFNTKHQLYYTYVRSCFKKMSVCRQWTLRLYLQQFASAQKWQLFKAVGLLRSKLTSQLRQHLTTALSVGMCQPLPLSNSPLLKGPHQGCTCNGAESWIIVQKNAWGTLHIQWRRVEFSALALMSGAVEQCWCVLFAVQYKENGRSLLSAGERVFICENPVG